MDFSWSLEQQALYDRFGRLAVALAIDANARDEDAAFASDEWQHCGRAGLLGLCVSASYGGLGLDCLTTAYVLEAFGRGCRDAGLCFSVGAHLLACALPIDQFGTSAQKEQYLRPLCSGASVGANAATEADAGSDVYAMAMSAKRRADGYVLNGKKSFVINAPIAGLFLIYAATRPADGPFGLSAFLVPRGTPGVVVGPTLAKSGIRTALASSLTLDGCWVPESQQLGPEGAGAVVFQASMGWERCCLFAFWLGTMERQMAEVIEHARTRRQFGRPIGMNQAVAHRIADMKLRLESARLLVYRACWERAQGHTVELSGSLAKLSVSEAFVQSSLDAVRIFGGAGVTRDAGIERYVRDALPSTIYSGTSEIQRDIVARSIGLPASRRG
jgi:alkylation response protein AidB-like acyl-CoA dehydrogenase